MRKWKDKKNHWAYTEKREEVLKELSKKLKGKKPNQTSFKEGQVSPRKGVKLSQEQIEKWKQSRLNGKGFKAWNKGKKDIYSEETLKKMALGRLGKPAWNKGQIGIMPTPWNKGKGIDRGLRALICSSSQYIQWRKQIFSRDGFKCIWCGSKKRIEADHIKAFAIICYENKIDSLKKAFKCKELWDINNGRTLCRECHKKTDTFCAKTKTK
jgi:hypothetical protein